MSCIYSSIQCKLQDRRDSSLSNKESCSTEMLTAQGPSGCGSRRNSEGGTEYMEPSVVKMLDHNEEVGNRLKVYRALRCDLNDIDKSPVKYNGITYRNPFRVTGGPVYLVGVEFFGHGSDQNVPYNVKVTVETPVWTVNIPWHHFFTSCFCRLGEPKIYGEVVRTVTSKKEDMWQVLFDYPVYIPPEKWIEINFHITGNINFCKMKPCAQKEEARIYTNDGVRQFHFLAGSCQMPVISFTVDRLKKEHEEKLKFFTPRLPSPGKAI